MDFTDNNPSASSDGNGNYWIRFTNYELPYFITTFIGATVSFEIGGVTYTGTLSNFQRFFDNPYFSNDGGVTTNYYNYVEFTPTESIGFTGESTITELTLTPGNNGVTFALLTALSDVDILGNLTTGNRVDVGESGDNSAELHVHGTIFLAEDNDGIVFGDTADSESVQLRTDAAGDDLTITGGGFVDIRPDSGFRVNSNERSEFRTDILVDTVDATDHVVTVQDEAETLSAGTGNKTVITPTGVEVNGTDLATSIGAGFAPNQGAGTATLSTLTVAGTTYNIPSPTGSTAVFPGVDVDLANSPTAFNIATFFTGNIDIDPGTGGCIYYSW